MGGGRSFIRNRFRPRGTDVEAGAVVATVEGGHHRPFAVRSGVRQSNTCRHVTCQHLVLCTTSTLTLSYPCKVALVQVAPTHSTGWMSVQRACDGRGFLNACEPPSMDFEIPRRGVPASYRFGNDRWLREHRQLSVVSGSKLGYGQKIGFACAYAVYVLISVVGPRVWCTCRARPWYSSAR